MNDLLLHVILILNTSNTGVTGIVTYTSVAIFCLATSSGRRTSPGMAWSCPNTANLFIHFYFIEI